jgi:hypothetical protein
MPPVKKRTTPESPTSEEPDYSSQELATLLGIPTRTLVRWQCKRDNPKYTVAGYHRCHYAKEEDLKDIEETTHASTSATQNYDLQH